MGRFNAEGPDGLIDRELSARPRHHAQAEGAIDPFQGPFPSAWRRSREQGLEPAAVEVWFADEARMGQKNKIALRWAPRGSRPAAPQDHRTASTSIFGAVCPGEGKGAALVLPFWVSAVMSVHLAEISQRVAPGGHAVLLLDRAGWHLSDQVQVPVNITLLPLPPKCPELNIMENVWPFMRDNWLSNRIFAAREDIVGHCCHAWNKLVAQPWRIMSIALRDWAHGS